MGAIAEKLMEKLTGFASVLRSVRDIDTPLVAERDRLRGEESGLLSLPEPKSQLAKAVPSEVRANGKLGLGGIDGLQLGRELSGSIVRDPHGDAPDTVAPRSLDSFRRLPVTVDLLCALIPDAVEAAILKLIPDSYESGPPLGERLPRLRAITARLAELETEHAALVDEAAASGITLQHWPNEIAKRHRAAEGKKSHDAWVAANRGYIKRAEAQAAAEGRR